MAFNVFNSKKDGNSLQFQIDGYQFSIADKSKTDLSITLSLAAIKRSMIDGLLNALFQCDLISLDDGYNACESLSLSTAERMILMETGFYSPFLDSARKHAPEVIGSSRNYKTYAPAGALAADVDIINDFGSRKPSRRIRVGVGGNLTLTPSEAGAADCTFYNVLEGESIDVEAIAIKYTTTSCQQISVFK